MTDWCSVVSRPKNKYSEVIAIRMIEPFSLRIRSRAAPAFKTGELALKEGVAAKKI